MLRIFSHYFSLHVLQRLGLDLLLLVVAVIASAAFQVHGGEDTNLQGLLPSALVFAVTMVLVNFSLGMYRTVDEDSPRAAFARFVLAVSFCMPTAYGVMLLSPWQGFSLPAMQLQVLVLVLLVLLLRVVVNRRQASSLFAPRILVVGTGEDAQEVQRVLSHPEQGRVEVQGFLPSGDDQEPVVDPGRIIAASSLSDAVRRLKIDEIIVAMRERRGATLPLRELLDCKLAGVRILDLPLFYERVRRQVRLDSLRASWLIYGEGFQQAMRRMLVKRVFDLVLGLGLLVLLSPVMLVAAFLILFDDRGSVFYLQDRVGLGGQIFKVIRFRCMRDANNESEPRGLAADDDRLTRVGRVIRRLRIDRLPQLLNVLAGDMSLVGPRPEQPYFVDRLAREIPFYGVRHCVKPGLTGWARVRYQDDDDGGDSINSAIQKLQYDLYYVKNHTLVLDTLVLLETVHVVLMGKGAQ